MKSAKRELTYSGDCGSCGVEVSIGLELKPGVTMKEMLEKAPRCFNDPCQMCGEEMEFGLQLPTPKPKKRPGVKTK